MNEMKPIWLAIAEVASRLGYTIEISAHEIQSWRNWARRRGQKLLAEFHSQRAARACVTAWLHHQPIYEGKSSNRQSGRYGYRGPVSGYALVRASELVTTSRGGLSLSRRCHTQNHADLEPATK